MKPIAYLLIVVFIFIFSSTNLIVQAQEDGLESNLQEILEVPTETTTQTTSTDPQPPTSGSTQSTSSTVQRTTSSNMSCVKVGSADDASKPTSCNQLPESGGGGVIGPINGGDISLQYCGEEPTGEVIMCYKPGYVFYCQGDPRWGSTCDLGRAGCGPTTMAMILSAFGDTIIPPDMDKIFQQRGWRTCGDNVSYMQAAVQAYLPEMGYEYHALGVPLNLNRAQEYLNAGYLIIGSTFGHIFVIDGVNPSDNTLRLRDPGRCENKDGVIRSASSPWGGQALMYAYAVKKKPAAR
jgi:hypothetical protein